MDVTLNVAGSLSDDSADTEQGLVQDLHRILEALPADVTITAATFTGPSLGTVDLLAGPSPLEAAIEQTAAAVAAIPAANEDGTYTLTGEQYTALAEAVDALEAAETTPAPSSSTPPADGTGDNTAAAPNTTDPNAAAAAPAQDPPMTDNDGVPVAL